MNIYVNDQKLDASLNEEKTLRDVYDAVDQWSRNQKQKSSQINSEKDQIVLRPVYRIINV